MEQPIDKSKPLSRPDLADLGTRFIALVIDSVLLSIVTGLIFGIFSDGGEVSGALSLIVGLAYYWYFWTRQEGQTLGKRIMSIRVVRADDMPLTTTDAILRYMGYYINSFVFMLGWIWAFIDNDRQGWHDKIAKTYVVRA